MKRRLAEHVICLLLIIKLISGEIAIRARVNIISRDELWPAGVVGFDVDPNLTKDMKTAVLASMRHLEEVTCIQWRQRYPWQKEVVNYVSFVRSEDAQGSPLCASQPGMKGGRQLIYLGDWCFSDFPGPELNRVAVLHEMMHTLGFRHVHQRPDRDCFLEINTQDAAYDPPNDNPYSPEIIEDYSTYDFESIMHYHETAIFKPKDQFRNVTLGRYDGKISGTDIVKVKSIYCGGWTYCELHPDECDAERKMKIASECSDWFPSLHRP